MALTVLAVMFAIGAATAQCDTGNEPECECSTAPVLCTIDELDAYSFSMSSFQHPQDGPTPLCTGPGNQNSVPNNPTWFAFIAWCETLTINVLPTNCTPFSMGINGVQVAIYSDCNFTPVACNVMSGDCNTDPKTLTMNNLEIGNTYYFLIDGCLGAYCDVEIDVVGTCGSAMIDDWSEPIDGPTSICANTSPTFSIEDLDGATTYHWYIDGVLAEEGTELIDFTQLWDTPGVYEICVDASNDPCIPESDPPDPLCITVEVFEAEAGDILATPNPVCPNDVINISSSGYITGAGYTHYIVITDDSGEIVAVVAGDATTWTYDACGTFFAYSISFHDAGMYGVPQVGENISDYDCADGCCDQEMVPLDFIDDEDPVFPSPPSDLDLACYDLLMPIADLGWTDNCDGSGQVAGTESGTADLCNGGTITREWEYSDQCGNTVEHEQTITIDPVPLPAFVNPPADITVDCSNIPSSAPSLQVTNTGIGGCAISATVNPVQVGSADVCGGSFSFEWQYTDLCDRTIMHTQNVTVTQIPVAAFEAAPNDTTVMCDAIPTGTPSLNYTNGGTGTCEISGSVAAQVTGSADLCGGAITYTWEFTDQCNRTIQETQTINVDPVPEAQYIDPPADTTVECSGIPTSHPSLMYTNGLTGPCLIEGTIAPVVTNNATACGGTITRQWDFTDPCGRQLSHTQTITVDPAPEATWVNPPADTTIECSDLPQNVPPLSYTNGGTGACAIAGSVPGVVTVNDLCQGIVQWQWTFTDICNRTITHTRQFTIIPPPPVTFANPPTDITVACGAVPYPVPDLNYTNGITGPCQVAGTVQGAEAGNVDYCGGQLTRTWTITDPCGNVYNHVQNISVDPAPPAVFASLPPDITLNCTEVPAVPPSLNYSNGQSGTCAIAGSVSASVGGSFNACGGDLTHTWTFTDNCGRTITHSRAVQVLPAPGPAFMNPPADVTLSCQDVPLSPPTLNYGNGLTGTCGISGTVAGTISGSYDECGGSIEFQWAFTDACGNAISHIQQIDVTPAPEPMWMDPPADVTLLCDEEYQDPPDLFISNNTDDPCAISAVVPANIEITETEYIHTWDFIHPCSGNLIQHEQIVTITPPVDIEIEPDEVFICSGDEFDLSIIIVDELDGQFVTVTYHTASPASPANELPSTLVTPLNDTEYVILGTSSFGCIDEAVVTIYADPNPNAGEDFSLEVCLIDAINLMDYISPDAGQDGYWIDPDFSGADLSDPTYVTFSDVDPGTYIFQYIVEGLICPPDTAEAEVTVNGEPDFTIDSVFCTGMHDFYTVAISGTDLEFAVSAGNVVTISQGIYQVQNIPIGETLSIDIWEAAPYCVYTYMINPPNCDCPMVPAPAAVPAVQICTGAPIPALTITAPAGTITHWFDAPTGGTLLLANSESYTPVVSGPGNYTFYVESESIDFPGCVSSTRTPVVLQILALPVVNDIVIEFCDDALTGELDIDLYDWRDDLTGIPTPLLTFHSTSADAENGTNSLSMPVTLAVGSQVFYARIEDINGCVSVATIDAILHPLPFIAFTVTDEACAGGSDGRLEITGFIPGEDYEVILNATSYGEQALFDNLTPGDYSVSVELLSTGCITGTDFTIDPGIVIDLTVLEVECNENGTDTDPSDDYYTIEFSVTTSGSGTMYELFGDGASLGMFTYGATQNIQVPADGTTLELVVTDVNLGCTDTHTTIPLTPCSSDCEITVELFNAICDDNGTPSDPSDDSYSIVLNATAVNGSTTNEYELLFDGVVFNTYSYGFLVNIIVFVGTAPTSIQIRDTEDPQCFINVMFDPFVGCSDACDMLLPNASYECNNNGTDDTGADDFYTIEFTPQVINPGASNIIEILVDGVPDQSVNVNTPVSVVIPADGMVHTITLADADIDTCTVSWQTPELDPCSSQCAITLESLSVDCKDNATPYDPSDDFYNIVVTASAVFGSASNSYSILVDGNTFASGEYNTPFDVMWPADGMAHTITLIDSDDMDCTLDIPVDALVPCSDSCILDASIIEIYCDNAGTNQTESDDIFYAVVLVEGTNVTGTWESTGPPAITGTIGSRDTLGPFLITDGAVDLDITASNPNCSAMLSLAAPQPCSSCEQTIDAGPDVMLDCGTPSAILTLNASEPGTFSWTDPFGDVTQGPIIEASNAGMYIAHASFTDGCAFSDTVFVTADPSLPVVWGGPDAIMNCVIREVTLSAQVITGTGPFEFEWTNAGGTVVSTNADYVANAPGTYRVQVYDAGVDCESGADAVVVSDISNNPSAEITTSPGSTLSCTIESVELSTDGEPNVVYTWHWSQGQSNQSVIEISSADTVTLVAFDTVTLCETEQTIIIEDYEEYPVILLEPFSSLSCDLLTVLLDASQSIISDDGTFTWTNDAGDTLSQSPLLNVDEAGTYYLALFDGENGCASFDTFTVEDISHFPVFTEGEDITLPCDEQTGTISITLTDPPGQVDINWNTPDGTILSGQNSQSAVVMGAGTYIVDVVDIASGCISSDTIFVLETTDRPSLVLLEAFPTSCAAVDDGFIEIGEVIGGTAPYEFLIDGNTAQEPIIDDLPAGAHTLTVIDANGCELDTSIFISIGDEISIILASSATIQLGESYEATAEVNIPANEIASVLWTPSEYVSCDTCLTTFLSPEENERYTVVVTDIFGCTASASIALAIIDDYNVYIPNTFSPGNGDGINDYFTAFTDREDAMIQRMEIFDRWGNTVYGNYNFEPNIDHLGWDGTFRGQIMNPAVFVYVIEIRRGDGFVEIFKGDLTLVR